MEFVFERFKELLTYDCHEIMFPQTAIYLIPASIIPSPCYQFQYLIILLNQTID